ncbi:MAG: hypothetical protein JSV41_07785 [Gemmatimonadota bacterium]|nr:MAG: hypothetical protein JSV41_07785 [Gemmatimonadota bacterium]
MALASISVVGLPLMLESSEKRGIPPLLRSRSTLNRSPMTLTSSGSLVD